MEQTHLAAQPHAVWGSAPFEAVAPTISDVHERVIGRVHPTSSVRWLDVACGTGNLAVRVAQAGANVSGIDFSPRMIETAHDIAKESGVRVDFRVASFDYLPYPDETFDVVSSTFGVMFASDHPATAAELARVASPGGTIALASWTEEGGDGDLFRLIGRFQPPPRPGAANPFRWGDPEYVDELLGHDFELSHEEQDSVLHISSGEEYWRLFSASFGPLKSLIDMLEPTRAEALHAAWVDWAEEMREGDEIVHHREYLLTLGTRRSRAGVQHMHVQGASDN